MFWAFFFNSFLCIFKEKLKNQLIGIKEISSEKQIETKMETERICFRRKLMTLSFYIKEIFYTEILICGCMKENKYNGHLVHQKQDIRYILVKMS